MEARPVTAPGVIVAAPASGCGKTVVMLAIARALVRRGLRVRAAKAGPDYIDTAYHAAATGAAACNLDPWAMQPQTLTALAAEQAAGADLLLCEGAMGLFDGAADGTGATADLAATLGWPVVLVVDIRGQAASAAALVAGFARHRSDVAVAGVVLNRAGSPRHARMAVDAIARAVPEVAVIGAVARDPGLVLPERHLGLVQAGEHAALDAFLDRAAEVVSEGLDLDALVALARPGPAGMAPHAAPGRPVPPPGQRIAVARDAAFAFCYPATLHGWRRAGAEIGFFSPLADEGPGDGADAVYLPGGYPELHAGRLAGNVAFLGGMRAAAARGAAVYGECGGYMVLGRSLTDADGTCHAMSALLPLDTSFADRRLHLGYRHAAVRTAGAFARAGERFRGHEFHYATVVEEGPGAALFDAADAAGGNAGPAGLAHGRVAGSFIHLIDRAP